MAHSGLHRRLSAIDRASYRVVCALCVTLLGVIVLTISASVISRFVIFSPLNFADPLSKYLMQWMAFLGIGLAIHKGEHVLVDMLFVALPHRLRLAISLLVACLTLVLFALVLRHGLTNALSARTSSDPFVFGVPMVYPYLSVPAGAAYALFQTLLKIGIAMTDPDGAEPMPHAVPTGL